MPESRCRARNFYLMAVFAWVTAARNALSGGLATRPAERRVANVKPTRAVRCAPETSHETARAPLARSHQFDNDRYCDCSGTGGNGCKPVCLLKL
jgi:hypothetical protein